MTESEDLPLTWTQRVRDSETVEMFEELQEELDDRNRQYGKSNTGVFAIRLAYMKLQELQELDDDIDKAVPE